MNEVLQPCPWCRDPMDEYDEVHGEIGNAEAIAVGCSVCQAHGPMALTLAEAFARWNTRRSTAS